jgi:anhydro-N-acetylmuramic acid kinase
MKLRTGRALDEDGKLAWAGEVDHARIARWLAKPFFRRTMPRSADRYAFDVLRSMKDMTTEDGAATLAAFTAQAIARDLEGFAPQTVIICGGGARNRAIMGMLRAHLPCPIKFAADVGWDGDALEAQAFAFLAARRLRGLPISFPGTTGAPFPLMGGVVASGELP